MPSSLQWAFFVGQLTAVLWSPLSSTARSSGLAEDYGIVGPVCCALVIALCLYYLLVVIVIIIQRLLVDLSMLPAMSLIHRIVTAATALTAPTCRTMQGYEGSVYVWTHTPTHTLACVL